MGAFEEAKRAFQAKLTTFYMDMEMKGAELETLLDLYRFRDKVSACRTRHGLLSLEWEASGLAQTGGCGLHGSSLSPLNTYSDK